MNLADTRGFSDGDGISVESVLLTSIPWWITFFSASCSWRTGEGGGGFEFG